MRGGQFAAQLSVPKRGDVPCKTVWLGTHPTAEEAALVVRGVHPNPNPNPNPNLTLAPNPHPHPIPDPIPIPIPIPNPDLNPNPNPNPDPSQVARYRKAHGLQSVPNASSRPCYKRFQYQGMSKARPTKVWPEWRRAGFTSAIGCPGRRLIAASLGQSASWASLAGQPGLVFRHRSLTYSVASHWWLRAAAIVDSRKVSKRYLVRQRRL